MALRIVFMGTPELAAAVLSALLDSDHTVVGVVSQPDRPAGRGRQVNPTPVAAIARANGLPLLQPASVKTRAFRAWVAQRAPDTGVVAAFGHILGPKALAVPRLGCINVHTSLLPRWRGASPIQTAIAAGDTETGVTLMQMDAGMDTGDMLHVVRTPITQADTGKTLHDRLAQLGAAAAVTTLDALEAGTLTPVAQDDTQATYAGLLKKSDGDIDWTRAAASVDRQVRAYSPWPGTRTASGADLLKVHPPTQVLTDATSESAPGTIIAAGDDGVDVVCGDGALLRLTRLQLPGRRAAGAGAVLRGYALTPGMRLGAHASDTA